MAPADPQDLLAGRAPITNRPDHTLLRPLNKRLEEGDPNLGTIVYGLLDLGHGPPRMMHAISGRIPRGTAERTVCLFPGLRRFPTTGAAGASFAGIDHVTLRDFGSHIDAYVRPLDYRENGKEKTPTESIDTDGLDEVQLFSMSVARPDYLDLAGIAYRPVKPGIAKNLRQTGALTANAFVKNHAVFEMGDAAQAAPEGHLQVTYLMSKRPLSEDATRKAAFYNTMAQPTDDSAPVHIAQYSHDLTVIFPDTDMPWLTVVAGIIPAPLPDPFVVNWAPGTPPAPMYEIVREAPPAPSS